MNRIKCIFGKHDYIHKYIKVTKNKVVDICLCKHCKKFKKAYVFNPNKILGLNNTSDASGLTSLYGCRIVKRRCSLDEI